MNSINNLYVLGRHCTIYPPPGVPRGARQGPRGHLRTAMNGTVARGPNHGVILLGEDFRPLLLAMQNLLEFFRYTVPPATTPAEALHFQEQAGSSIRLLLMRLLLPGMPGPALAAQIRIRAPNLAVLYMSDDLHPRHGGAFERDIRASLLPNPFTEETLLERVSALLGVFPGRRQPQPCAVRSFRIILLTEKAKFSFRGPPK
jgi:DNA-binding response OmpR family regulator